MYREGMLGSDIRGCLNLCPLLCRLRAMALDGVGLPLTPCRPLPAQISVTASDRTEPMVTIARFRDENGWTWEAVERTVGTDGVAAPALYFISRYQTRRCDRFPTDWERRTPDELLDLCEAAVPL